jgi:restriction endonuclease BglII
LAKKPKQAAPQSVPAEPIAIEPGTKPEGKLPDAILRDYDVREWKHATAILQTDFPAELMDIVAVLSSLRVRRSHITVGGGGKSKIAQAIDVEFKDRGWVEKKWDTKIVVDNKSSESPTHKVDCYKNRVAVELEWNNKDPFFDRDLNNFRLLFDLRVISVGVIITKSEELVDVFKGLGSDIWDKYGRSTTWMSKLLPRIEGGGGGGCPILVFGIRRGCFLED